MANPLASNGLSDRDYATVVGTMMGEAYKEGVKGMAAVGDVIANRHASEDSYGIPIDSSLAGTALASRPNNRGKEFDAWNATVAPGAYAIATQAARAAIDPAYAASLPQEFRGRLEQAQQAAYGVFGTGTLRGITQGATFYNNPAYTSAKMNTVMDAARPTGSVRIGGHVFGGPEFNPNAKFDQSRLERSWTEYQNSFTTPTENRVMAENMARQRDEFRGPSDYGAPVWDGTYDNTTLAAPVGRVDSAPLADIGYQPGPDLGANLSSAVPSSDLSPSITDYGFSGMAYGPAMAAQQNANFGSYLGTVPGGGTFAPDTSYAPGPDLGANLSSQVPSDYAPADAGWGRTADKDTTAAPPSMDIGPQSFSTASMGSMATNPGFGAGITPNAMPSIGPTSFSNTNMIDPGMTGAFGITGIAGMAPSSPSTHTWGMDGIPSAKPFDAPAPQVQPTELPGYTLPDDVPAPTFDKPNTPAAAPSKASPEGFRSAPAAAPASKPSTPSVAPMGPPRDVPTLGVKEAAPAPAQTYADALRGFGAPDSFLGGLMGGNRSGLDALNAATGMDYGGLVERALAGDQYSQPAMLGLERAYAEATGQVGPRGLFDGLFGSSGSTRDDGLGAVRDQATGAILGMTDPSDPKNQGLFGGLFGGWGWGGNDSLGNTPGAGGLY